MIYECYLALPDTAKIDAHPSLSRRVTAEERDFLFHTLKNTLMDIGTIPRDNPDHFFLPLALAVVLSLALSRQLFQPIQRLHKAIREVAHNNLDVYVPHEHNDELGQLADRFNDMLVALKRNQEQLLENQRDIRVTRRYFEFMRPYTREYARKNPPTEKYYRQRDFYLHLPRVTGYLSFFRCVAIVLGVAPLYEKEYRQPLSAECREACRRLDRFTAEITLVCREHLDTPEDVQRFLARMDKEMDAISAARSKIRNKQRGCADPVERVELKKSCAACTAELSRLRKQKQTAYNMIEDNPRLKDLLACELDAWVENDPYLSPREKQALRNQRLSQEEKTIMR